MRVGLLGVGLLGAGLLGVGLLSDGGIGGGGVAGASTASGLNAPSRGVDCTPATALAAQPDEALDRVFSDQMGPGWVGGDASYSTELPNGSDAFVFSDTLIGTAEQDGSAKLSGMAHNSELVGWLPQLSSNYGGTFGAPQSLIPDPGRNGDHWQVGATSVEHGDQLVFVNEFLPRSVAFEHFTGRAGIAVLGLRQNDVPTFKSVELLATDPLTQWGNAVTQDSRYTYVYGAVGTGTAGSDLTGTFAGMKVARLPRGTSLLTDDWEYWNGLGWVAGEGNAVMIPTGNELTGVAPDGSTGYEAVSIPSSVFTDTTVDISYACSPEGPWSTPVPVYAIPNVKGLSNQVAYIPTFHLELSSGTDRVISYNVNSADSSSLHRADVHGYQPRFVVLGSNPRVPYPGPLPPAETPEAPVPLMLPMAAAILMIGVYALRHRRARRAPSHPEK